MCSLAMSKKNETGKDKTNDWLSTGNGLVNSDYNIVGIIRDWRLDQIHT